MHNLKRGDKVIIKSEDVSPLVTNYKKGDEAVVVAVYKSGGVEVVMYDGCHQVILWGERAGEVFEKFIEPKYKKYQKIYAFPALHKSGDNDDVAEIVAVNLNKVKGEYAYMAFGVNSGIRGMVCSFLESEIVPVVKSKPVVEMTLAEVCKKLGRNIKIVK